MRRHLDGGGDVRGDVRDDVCSGCVVAALRQYLRCGSGCFSVWFACLRAQRIAYGLAVPAQLFFVRSAARAVADADNVPLRT